MNLWTELLVKPIFNLLVLIYSYIPGSDLAVAIILLTLLIKLVLYPFNKYAIISQRSLARLQPQIEELKEKHKDNREKLGAEMMALYKREKINPFSSCLPLLIQLPILFAVYQVFIKGLSNGSFDLLYPWVTNPGHLNTIALGFLDLSQKNIILAVFAGLAQFWQSKMMMNKKEKVGSMASAMNAQMLYMMPLMTIWIGSIVPAGLTLYWFVTTLFSALQQLWMMRRKQVA